MRVFSPTVNFAPGIVEFSAPTELFFRLESGRLILSEEGPGDVVISDEGDILQLVETGPTGTFKIVSELEGPAQLYQTA